MVRDGIGVPFYGARRFALSGVAALRLRYDIHFRARLRYEASSLGARVAQTARSQIGAHYRLGGTTPKGFDCSGLIWWAYRQHGINVPRVTDAQAKAGYGVGRGIAMRPGDILVFDTRRGRTGLHTALYTGNGRFVHSPTSGKRVREDSLSQEYWKKRLIRVRRIVR